MNDCAKKYLVEGDINFFAELKKTIGHGEVASAPSVENACLITNNALIEHSVTLPCNHTFNYIPLYNEIKIQKCVKNTAETAKLLMNEIKCPYCRKIHKTVLPYYEDLCESCPILYGVNTLDLAHKVINCCNYVKYVYTDGTQMYCELTGDNLHYCADDKQYYCYNHLYIVCKKKQKELKHQEQVAKIKKIKEEQQLLKNALKNEQKNELKNEQKNELKNEQKNELKNEQKNEQKNALKNEQKNALKNELKNELKNALKNELKNELKNAKATAKLALKANSTLTITLPGSIIDAIDETNEVIQVTANVTSCAQILKTGLFKGGSCNKPIYKKNMCKRHFNLSNAKLLDVVITDDTITIIDINATDATDATDVTI